MQNRREAVAAVERRAPTAGDETRTVKVVAVAVVAVVTALALTRIGRPFWVDEITTAWMAEGDWSTTIGRIDRFATNSPAYPIFMWVWVQAFGLSPIALRAPSVIAVAATAVVVHRTASDIGRPATAWASVAVFVTFTEVSVSAGNARAYAFAMLFVALMHRSVLGWIDRGDRRSAVGAAAWATLAVHAHVLMLPAAGVVVVAVWLRRQRSEAWRRELMPLLMVGVVGALTLAPSLLTATERSGSFDSVIHPTPAMLFHLWISPAQLVIVALALLLGGRLRPHAGDGRANTVYLAAAAFVPLVVAWSLARGLDMGVFLPRYLVGILPPMSILAARAILGIRRPLARLTAAVGMVGFGLVALLGPVGNVSNWEQAVEWTNAITADHDAAVLLEPLHLMGRDRSFFVDATGNWIFEGDDSLTWVNPLETAHPIDAPTYGLPYAATTWGVDYLDAVLAERAQDAEMVVLIGNYTRVERDYTELVRLRMAERGYVEQPTPELDREVLLFTRD